MQFDNQTIGGRETTMYKIHKRLLGQVKKKTRFSSAFL